jgi:hypothetical protein
MAMQNTAKQGRVGAPWDVDSDIRDVAKRLESVERTHLSTTSNGQEAESMDTGAISSDPLSISMPRPITQSENWKQFHTDYAYGHGMLEQAIVDDNVVETHRDFAYFKPTHNWKLRREVTCLEKNKRVDEKFHFALLWSEGIDKAEIMARRTLHK